ncbi:MAG: TlyA family RNA methyltransferase [Spirochaetia bacterium]|nr:TlyA family RNA methyltransferase [Spirochaetia bacterium]
MRLDQYLVEKEYLKSLSLAQSVILAGKVLVNDKVESRAGYSIKEKDVIRIKPIKEHVSRSAEKLKTALEKWNFDVKNRSFIDIGASTGGFTETLLEKGAVKVIALDVAYGFLHPKLRKDKRVFIFERKNIRRLKKEEMPFMPDYFTADVSFISIRKVLKSLQELRNSWEGIILFKPQFEADKKTLKKGIVSEETDRKKLLDDFYQYLKEYNITHVDTLKSSIAGTKGNIEYLIWLKW